jgi:hypothetical protein
MIDDTSGSLGPLAPRPRLMEKLTSHGPFWIRAVTHQPLRLRLRDVLLLASGPHAHQLADYQRVGR